ncbi:epoxide hydrolase family protein [Baekduia alba]|uniref:epoxide hydrolase family protein n=1 Tax=Baekduia alba TaxID=2997333 RepID=UPI0032C4A2EA
MEPYVIEIPDAELDDLRARLGRTRWPARENVPDWSQGIPLAYVQELCETWATTYDWRRCEAELNAAGSSQTAIDGLDVHFLHVRSPHAGALPLLVTHGWPGSVVEFLDVLHALADPPDPADAFHVVCPSLPGFGFSGQPPQAGWGADRTARAWAQLMPRLGYERYGAQGGDWGAMVTTRLAQVDGAHLVGIHLNMVVVGREAIDAAGPPTPQERALLQRYAEHRDKGSAYASQQRTRPQTLGYGLADSPAAQCAWIAEKFHAWTDNDGHPEDAVSRDRLLDNVMLYWLTNAGATSARMYWESFAERELGTIAVPTGASLFPKEIVPASERWIRHRFPDLRYCNEPDRGGHFAALEQPELFAEEVRAAFRTMR